MTVKTIKKKQKHKGRGTVRIVTKQVPNDSFFNFFNPIKGEIDGKRSLVKLCRVNYTSILGLCSDVGGEAAWLCILLVLT